MKFSEPVDWINTKREGYVVNAGFSDDNVAKIGKIIAEIQSSFGSCLYFTPPEALHFTLLDVIAPLVDYDGKDKAKLLRR